MLNKVTLIGNLGTDPESRFMPNGNQVVTLSIATTMSWKDKTTGEKKSETEWHRVTMFGALAEIAAKYLTKGSKVYIEGRIKTTKYNKEGVDHYSTGIISDVMKMLDSKPEGNYSDIKAGEASKQAQSKSVPDYPVNNNYPDDFNDDIPF
jgi:single-strand DNA-binding protein